MAGSPLVTRADAYRKRTHHQYLPGMGYLAHSGPPELPAAARGTKNCDPGPNTPDGSRHLLKPPTGAPAIIFLWVPSEQAWASPKPGKGNRLAWPKEHLMRAGWEYVGPVK